MYRTLLLTTLLFSLLSCVDDKPKIIPEPTKEELLVKERQVISVSSNDMAVDHSGFTIDFKSDGNFSFNTPGISGLPPSGKWEFSTNNNIKLDGTIDLHVGILNANKFVFTFNSTSHKDTNVETEFTME
tara:strand:+ start:3619 stop:4005 length:387 start_codon:yes stop_codon:yes gene_type:complete